MWTLGINAAFHDSSACLVRDGEVVAAVEEERLTRIKHAKRPVPFSAWELPFAAVDFCLKQAGLRLIDLDHVAYSFDPRLLLDDLGMSRTVVLPLEPSAGPKPKTSWHSVWEPLFVSHVANAPRQLVSGAPHHLETRFRGAERASHFKFHFIEHHLSHAASAFHASPFEEAAVLTLDGRGEKVTSSCSVGRGSTLRRISEVEMPHSLGLLYEEVTRYLGFLHSSDEYKVMALAGFGKPLYLKEFRDMVQLDAGGRYRIVPARLEELFGPRRMRGEPFARIHYDITCSLQTVLEETVLEIVRWLHQESGLGNLCFAGGVALNCVLNSKIAERGPFDEVWIQPAAGDSGTSLGAALWIDSTEREKPDRRFRMEHVYLGPAYEDAEVERFLNYSKAKFRRIGDIPDRAADLLMEDKIIGWFQGREEFGPRALGARSILASPLRADMQDRLNEIKDREDFRPVAPVVLEEEAPNWFRGARQSPYMLFVYEVLPEKAGLIPAVRHVDGTARIQTVRRDQNALYYDLLRAFHRRSGVPVLVNTSFNSRSEPIVSSPRDAVECFYSSPLDALIIGSFLLEKHC